LWWQRAGFFNNWIYLVVYIKIPQGLDVKDDTSVCRLKKSLYGLKEASREWNHRLSSFLAQLGYT
jgi:hypothetical protein